MRGLPGLLSAQTGRGAGIRPLSTVGHCLRPSGAPRGRGGAGRGTRGSSTGRVSNGPNKRQWRGDRSYNSNGGGKPFESVKPTRPELTRWGVFAPTPDMKGYLSGTSGMPGHLASRLGDDDDGFSKFSYFYRDDGVPVASVGKKVSFTAKRCDRQAMRKLKRGPMPIEVIHKPDNSEIPELKHGLERALLIPGVHPLRTPDPKSHSPAWGRKGGRGVRDSKEVAAAPHMVGADGEPIPGDDGAPHGLQFPSFLRRLHSPEEVDQGRVSKFVTTSEDRVMHDAALKSGAKFKGSTSSLTGLMTSLYHHVSNHKPLHGTGLQTEQYQRPSKLTYASLAPNSVMLRPQDGVYALDGNPPFGKPKKNVLADMGHSLEAMLTQDEEEFKKVLLPPLGTGGRPMSPEEKVKATQMDDGFLYTKAGDFLLRSQLDCRSDVLPGATPENPVTFDLKTRALRGIRHNMDSFEKYTSSSIKTLTGYVQSFEAEFYDLTRSAFIKYALQARIGQMGGIMVAYHNTRTMFGFEYLPIHVMDRYVYGNEATAEFSFHTNLKLLNLICSHVVAHHDPRMPLRLTLHAQAQSPHLEIYSEEVPQDTPSPHRLPGAEPVYKHTPKAPTPLPVVRRHLLRVEVEDKDGNVSGSGFQVEEDNPFPNTFLSLVESTPSTYKDLLLDYALVIDKNALNSDEEADAMAKLPQWRHVLSLTEEAVQEFAPSPGLYPTAFNPPATEEE